MSYDVFLEADMGNGPVRVHDLEANCTYNVSGMFREAVGSTPNDWDGRSAADVAVICGRIVDALESDVTKYDAMNPSNGWGDRRGAVEFIRKIQIACREAPKATVRVC